MKIHQRESTAKLTGVLETLMITLYARYVEAQRPDSILKDEKAVEIAERLDYDFKKFAKGWASQLGCVIRAKAYDEVVRNFIENNPKAVIVNLGAGLCTRFFRVDNSEIRWYEVDFPDVIELKGKFVEKSDRYQFIACSILDSSWIDDIKREANQPLLIIMEGVSMYLTEAENRLLFQYIYERLSPVEMIFDLGNLNLVKNTKRHDTVSKTNVEFKWGIENSYELENWGVGITHKEEVYYLTRFADYPQRLPWWCRYFLFILVPLSKNSGRIVRIQIQ